MTYIDYPPDCKLVPDGPCKQKLVMIHDDNKPCTGPVSGVGR